MNMWFIGAALLLLGLVPCGVVILKAETADGLAALQLAGTITTLALLLLAAGDHRAAVADIPLALALLSFPAGLLFALFLERWL